MEEVRTPMTHTHVYVSLVGKGLILRPHTHVYASLVGKGLILRLHTHVYASLVGKGLILRPEYPQSCRHNVMPCHT